MVVIEDNKAGVSAWQIEMPAVALSSRRRAIKKWHAECLTELMRLERKTQEMENAHAQAIARIKEREHAAQENFKAAQAKHRAAMSRIAANNANPTCQFTPSTQEMGQTRQREKMNILVFIIQAILFGCGIVTVGILRLMTRKFHRQDISCGKIYSTRPPLGQIRLNPANFY